MSTPASATEGVARQAVTSYEEVERWRQIELILAAFRWPDESVCGYSFCTRGYCLECHIVAYSAMLRAREYIVDALVQLGRAP